MAHTVSLSTALPGRRSSIPVNEPYWTRGISGFNIDEINRLRVLRARTVPEAGSRLLTERGLMCGIFG
jgi:hypothetical protein